MLNLEGKKAIVADVASAFAQAASVAAAHYRGLTVEEITSLRNEARTRQVQVRVVRNTLARRAAEGTDFACMQEALVGPLVLFFSMEEPSACAKLIRDFSKEHEKLAVQAIALDGVLLGPEKLSHVASLPTLEESRGLLVATLQAPATHLARTLGGSAQEMQRTLKAIADGAEKVA
jgi:large subunit ribosomal protein L10